MKKDILVSGNKLEEYIDTSIVADDVNAYELILNTKEDLTDCIFEIVGTRSDGAVITDIGETDGNCAKYLLKNSMYAVPGNLVLRLRILNEEQSALTTKILNLNVIEGSGSEEGVTATNEYPVLTKLIIDTKEISEKAEAVTKEAEEIVGKIPVVVKNENTIVTKAGEHFIGEDCNNGFVAGKENKYNEGKYTVIFGHKNEVTGHSNIVSGSENKVKGLHNLVVGNKLKVEDDGLAQVVFGLGEDVSVPNDVAIAYYQLGKPAFLVTKDGDLTLNNKPIASIPACDIFDDTYTLKSDTTNIEYSMDKVGFVGADQYTHRLVVNNMPEVSEDWIGYTIEFTHINEDGTAITESTRIRNIERLDTNQPIISIDKEISNMTDDTKTYWNSFTIKGAKYVWDAPNTALIPLCESDITEDYLPVYINVNDKHSIGNFRVIGSNTTQYRLVIDKSLIPNLSRDWIGYTIEFTSKENETERTEIRDIEDGSLSWIIVIDKTISHMNSESEAKEYWATFTIKGNKYIWLKKPTVDQTYDAESENAQSGKAVAEIVDAINKGIEEFAENVNKDIEDVANKVEDIVLSDIERASIPICKNDGKFVLECDAVNRNYPGDTIDVTGETTTNGYRCGRIVVFESDIPDISSVDWIGKEITLRNTHTSGKETVYTSIIRGVSERSTVGQWNIDFDFKDSWYSGSSWNGGFAIKGADYTWKSKTELFEEIKNYMQG